MQSLIAVETDCNAKQDYNRLVYEATMLMKRIAMRQYGRQTIAGKRQSEFISYINGTWTAAAFNNEDQALFSHKIYNDEKVEATDARQYTNKVKSWIRQHRHKSRSADL